MNGSYKFFRHAQGVSSFAEITISAAPSDRTSIEWVDASLPYKSLYSSAVAKGIEAAVARRVDAAGKGWSFKVESFTELPVDTKPDAVTCASTMAAWKAMGGSESDIAFTQESGVWRASFAAR